MEFLEVLISLITHIVLQTREGILSRTTAVAVPGIQLSPPRTDKV
jgi:hypothetical protein